MIALPKQLDSLNDIDVRNFETKRIVIASIGRAEHAGCSEQVLIIDNAPRVADRSIQYLVFYLPNKQKEADCTQT